MAMKITMMFSLILTLFLAQVPKMEGNIFTQIQVSVKNLQSNLTGLPSTNSTSPVISGAMVQVRLENRTLANGTTDRTGSVNITLVPVFLGTNAVDLVNKLVANGTVRILTPVLNQTAGFLTSPLKQVESFFRGMVFFYSLVADGFTVTL